MDEQAVVRYSGQYVTAFYQRLLMVVILLAGMLGTGCATVSSSQQAKVSGEATSSIEPTVIEPTVVSYPEYRDPLIAVNRAIFAFNDVTYRYLLIPLSKGYIRVVPEPARKSIGNFFYNIKTPIYAVNNVLQLEPERLGRNLLRFVINTTVGLLGLFDPAQAWFNLERAETHFDETLAGYGTGYGIYLVLPFFGPSDLRSGASTVVDYFLNPIPYLVDEPEATVLQGFDYFQVFAPGAERYNTLRAESEDPYIFFRNLHLQGVQRDVEY